MIKLLATFTDIEIKYGVVVADSHKTDFRNSRTPVSVFVSLKIAGPRLVHMQLELIKKSPALICFFGSGGIKNPQRVGAGWC